MRYLFAIWDGGGTVPVELGIAQRLIASGHQVTVLADPVLAPDVDASGASFRPWVQAPHRNSSALSDEVLKDWECHNPLELFRRLRDRMITGPSATYAADVRDALVEGPTDAVIANGALLGAMVGAESRRVPTVAICPNVYLRSARGMPPFGLGLKPASGPVGLTRDRLINAAVARMWRTGLPALNATRHSLGLPDLRDPWQQWDHCARVLVTTARAFDIPAQLPANVRYVGPILDDPDWAAEEVSGLQNDLPMVVVAFSSTYVPGQRERLRRVVAALDGLPVRGIVTTGPTIDPAEVPATSRVRVVRSASHARLFADAAAVVTHAGHGTIIKALAAGVPAVCIPQGRDQGDNVVRVERQGAGIGVKRTASVGAVHRALRRILDDPTYRERARALGASIRDEVEHSTLITELEDAAVGRADAGGTPSGDSHRSRKAGNS
jgi:UDP:flavonoid glycosyltransferase YjiC (YdhE family)